MNWLLIIFGMIVIFILMLECYMYRGIFKKIFHDKLKIHTPDFKNWLDYNEQTQTVFSACKYCDEEIVYKGVCNYLVHNNPKKIPDSLCNAYCRECISKQYTKNKNCCPLHCDKACLCKYCEEDNNEN